MSWYGGWAPYVPVAERRRNAKIKLKKMFKKGTSPSPIWIDGRTIARSFWGASWCDNLESYSDYETRLPKGRTYVRNGSVVHLAVKNGIIEAFVAGSELYSVKVEMDAVSARQWESIKKRCSGQIDSLVELLAGRLSQSVMKVMTTKKTGLFPSPKQISLSCSCPDGARMCKHVAATLYGIGAKLDEKPELLFQMRGVDHRDLIEGALAGKNLGRKKSSRAKSKGKLKGSDLSSLFGVEIVTKESSSTKKTAKKGTSKKKVTKKGKAKKKVAKKVVKKKASKVNVMRSKKKAKVRRAVKK